MKIKNCPIKSKDHSVHLYTPLMRGGKAKFSQTVKISIPPWLSRSTLLLGSHSCGSSTVGDGSFQVIYRQSKEKECWSSKHYKNPGAPLLQLPSPQESAWMLVCQDFFNCKWQKINLHCLSKREDVLAHLVTSCRAGEFQRSKGVVINPSHSVFPLGWPLLSAGLSPPRRKRLPAAPGLPSTNFVASRDKKPLFS